MHPDALREIDWPLLTRMVASFAATGAGRELVEALVPSPHPPEVARRRDETQELSALVAGAGRLPLADVPEAGALLEQLGVPGAVLAPAEVVELRRLAVAIAAVRRQAAGAPAAGRPALAPLLAALFDTGPLLSRIDQVIGADGEIRDDASPALAHLRQARAAARRQLTRQLERFLVDHADDVQDAVVTMRRERFVVPLKVGARRSIPGLVHERSGSGATVFFEPLAAVDLNNEVAELAAQEEEEIVRILTALTRTLAAEQERLVSAAAALAALDAIAARAEFGVAAKGILAVQGEARLALVAARHPLIDERLAAVRGACGLADTSTHAAQRVVPLTVELAAGRRVLLVSGPNAGGKTVTLKTVGLFAAMAQCGIPLPAEVGSELPVFDAIATSIGDAQSVLGDLSTFTAALSRWARVLDGAGPRTLVLLDELGSGTDPAEGAALGRALLEELAARGSWTLATTHLGALSELASSDAAMENAAMEYDLAAGLPTYRLRAGVAGRSQALAIAARRLPAAVVARARVHLGEERARLDDALARAEERERLAELHAAEAETLLAAARLREAEAETRSRQAAERAEGAEREVRREWRGARDAMQRRLAETIERLEKDYQDERDKRKIGAAALVAELERDLLPAPVARASATAADLAPGDEVEAPRLGLRGRLVSVRRDGSVEIESGNKRITVPRAELRTRDADDSQQASRYVRVQMAERREAVPLELHLIGKRVGEALEELDRYLDRALGSGMREVRIVHGHGSGRLRDAVRAHLRGHAAVAEHRSGGPHEGAGGATVVTLVS